MTGYRGVFMTGTGTDVGKTVVAERICELLTGVGQSVVALKPIETGVQSDPQDALRLARACGRPEFASWPGFYRVAPPLSPLAATLAGETPFDFGVVQAAIASAIASIGVDDPFVLVEGAGGPLVPIDETRTVADLCLALGLPALLVARDHLGTQSHTHTAIESLRSRGVEVLAVVLNRFGESDTSQDTNGEVLASVLPVPIWRSDALGEHVASLLAERS